MTAFVNRCGTIGLSLLPMLLVQRGTSTASSSAVMAVVKATMIVGLLASGVAADRLGPRRTVLLAFTLSGVGLLLLPRAPSLALVAAAAVVAQLGEALSPSAIRLLLITRVPPEGQREALGWLRGAANLGHVMSYGAGIVFTAAGVLGLMWFDSLTSLVAALIGLRLLRDAPAAGAAPRPAVEDAAAPRGLSPLFACAAVLGGFMFLYDLFTVSASAAAERAFGARGLAVFSEMMIINVVFCALLAVAAARVLKRVSVAFPLGILLAGAGTAVTTAGVGKPLWLFAGAFIVTVGEVVLGALSQYALLRAAPAGPRRGTYYSAALVVQTLGRIAGGTLAFPMVVDGAHGTLFVVACTAGALALWGAARPLILRAMPEG
jgi:Major Facilitator Superfamily